jgi:transketolase
MGSMVGKSMNAASILENKGIRARVINLSSVKPLDNELILQCAQETGAIVTAEEHSVIGGLGGAVAELLVEECPTPLTRVGINDRFALTGPDPEAVLDYFGMGVDHIVSAAEKVLRRKGR